jgi:hypothetical protein
MEDHDPLTGLPIAYVGNPNTLPEKHKECDLGPRQRKPLAEFVFGGQWANVRHRAIITQ